jgi:hypothetical protein
MVNEGAPGIIDATKKLPATSGFVIAVDSSGEALTLWYDAERREFDRQGITHWIPLPKK